MNISLIPHTFRTTRNYSSFFRTTSVHVDRHPFNTPFRVKIRRPTTTKLFPYRRSQRNVSTFTRVLINFLTGRQAVKCRIRRIITRLRRVTRAFTRKLRRPQCPFIAATFRNASTTTNTRRNSNLTISILRVLIGDSILFVTTRNLTSFTNARFLCDLNSSRAYPIRSLTRRMRNSTTRRRVTNVSNYILPMLTLRQQLTTPSQYVISGVIVSR